MALINSDVIPASATGGYTIDQSLRFDLSSEAYLSRSMTSTGNRKTWTWSAWVKLSNLQSGNSYPTFFDFASSSSSNTRTKLYLDAQQRFAFQYYDGSNNYYTTGLPIYRDLSAWYHIVVRCDSTQSTSSNRLRLYVNGEELSKHNEGAMPQNHDTYANLSGYTAMVGNAVNDGGYQRDYGGYMAEVHHIDGQSLDASYFGQTGDYGEWKPIAYTGSYGTNGFYLDFSGTYYNDKSGNGNNFTATNLSTTDVVLDSPTNNFATMNPLNTWSYQILSEGNLKGSSNTSDGAYSAPTINPNSGKWYFEYVVTSTGYNSYYPAFTTFANVADINRHTGEGTVRTFSSLSGSAGDIIGVALDIDTLTAKFYKNGTYSTGNDITLADPDTDGGFGLGTIDYLGDGVYIANFGQDSSFAGNKTAQGNTDSNGIGDFYYSPPSGYLALCTANLPDPAVIPSEHFNTVLWTGDGTSSRNITGVGFQPDFTWIKARSVANWNLLQDAVRGVQKQLFSNATNSEESRTDRVKQFISDGFEIGNWGDVNTNGTTYASWNWKSNGSGVSNTDGSITSTVSANPDAGFSIVSYTGTGTSNLSETIGHGLSQAPDVIIVKDRDVSEAWIVYHSGNGASPETQRLLLNATNATASYGQYYWNNTAPTSSVFTIGSSTSADNVLNDTNAHIAYCFHSVDGFSKVGSYTGNGSTDGTFVYTGFRPAYVIFKRTDVGASWCIEDTARNTYNPADKLLLADNPIAEVTSYPVDFVSNGFKIRTSNVGFNASSGTYIYIAFAEHPFKYTNAR